VAPRNGASPLALSSATEVNTRKRICHAAAQARDDRMATGEVQEGSGCCSANAGVGQRHAGLVGVVPAVAKDETHVVAGLGTRGGDAEVLSKQVVIGPVPTDGAATGLPHRPSAAWGWSSG
jgi:hypothetical protein